MPCSRCTTRSPSLSSLKSIEPGASQTLRRAAKRRRPCVGGAVRRAPRGEHDKIGRGKQKPRASVSLRANPISPNEILASAMISAKPFDFTFGLEVNCDPCPSSAKLLGGRRTASFRFGDDELAGVELADLAIAKGSAEIFRSSSSEAKGRPSSRAESNAGRGIAWRTCMVSSWMEKAGLAAVRAACRSRLRSSAAVRHLRRRLSPLANQNVRVLIRVLITTLRCLLSM